MLVNLCHLYHVCMSIYNTCMSPRSDTFFMVRLQIWRGQSFMKLMNLQTLLEKPFLFINGLRGHTSESKFHKLLELNIKRNVSLKIHTSGWSVSCMSCLKLQFGCRSKSLNKISSISPRSLLVLFVSVPLVGVFFFS